MTRIALLADDHFGCRNDHAVLADNLDLFYKDVFWPWIDRNQDVKEIIHLGDLFDRRKYVSFNTAFRLRRAFTDQLTARQAAGRGLMLTVILGNHDLPFKHKMVPNGPYELLPRTFNIRIIVRPTEIGWNGRKFLLLPWVCDATRDETFEFVKETDATGVIGHLEFAGAMLNRKTVSEKGLSQADFDRFEAVYSGHFHHRHFYKNICYLGSTREQTWSDWADQKGFHVLDTDEMALSFIPNYHTVFEVVPFSRVKEDFSRVKGKIVRVTCDLENVTPVELESFIADVNKEAPADLRVAEPKKPETTQTKDVPFDTDLLSMLTDAAQTDAPLKNLLEDLYQEARELEQNA